MTDWIQRFFQAAKNKVTTYLALFTSAGSLVADHAEELKAQLPEVFQYLPPSKTLDHFSHVSVAVLGILIVYARVRRLLKVPDGAPK
jgi:hypothetical protein